MARISKAKLWSIVGGVAMLQALRPAPQGPRGAVLHLVLILGGGALFVVCWLYESFRTSEPTEEESAVQQFRADRARRLGVRKQAQGSERRPPAEV